MEVLFKFLQMQQGINVVVALLSIEFSISVSFLNNRVSGEFGKILQ